MAKKAAIIAAFDPSSSKGGIETYTMQLLSLLKAKGVETTLYHTGLVKNAREAQRLNLHNTFLAELYSMGRRLREEEKRYDFMISNSYYGMGCFPPAVKTFTIYHSVYAGFIEKYRESSFHDPFFYFKFLCEEMGEYIAGHNTIKIAVSEGVKSELQSIYGFNDVTVIHHGLDTELFKREGDRGRLRREFDIPEDAFVGIFVGRWETEKRHSILRDIVLQRPDVFWLVVSARGGEENDLQGRPNVRVKQEVPYEYMPVMYSLADFMLFPSAYEGFGMAIIEAMACGLPIITTNVGIASLIYRDKPFAGLLLPDIDVESNDASGAINERIALLKEDRELREKVSAAGAALVKERFTLKRWQRDMEQVLGI